MKDNLETLQQTAYDLQTAMKNLEVPPEDIVSATFSRKNRNIITQMTARKRAAGSMPLYADKVGEGWAFVVCIPPEQPNYRPDVIVGSQFTATAAGVQKSDNVLGWKLDVLIVDTSGNISLGTRVTTIGKQPTNDLDGTSRWGRLVGRPPGRPMQAFLGLSSRLQVLGQPLARPSEAFEPSLNEFTNQGVTAFRFQAPTRAHLLVPPAQAAEVLLYSAEAYVEICSSSSSN